MDGRISITVEDGVADVRLIRTDKMNALDQGMFEALLQAGDKLAATAGLRAVVLSGEGRAFCAGLDKDNFGRMAQMEGAGSGGGAPGLGRLEARTHGIANRAQQVVMQWRDLPVPVIAAVHGVAFGGGFQIALGADMRYVAPGTKFSVMEAKWGLVPDMAGMALMRHLAREDVVRELTYTARVFSAEEALAYGFATKLTDTPREDALATARDIANKNPEAIRAAKRILNIAPLGSTADVLLAESVEQDKLIGSPNQREAVMANLENRLPRFLAG